MDHDRMMARTAQLLCASRSIDSYLDLVDAIAMEAADGLTVPCEERHFGDWMEGADRVAATASGAGPACSSVEVSEFVTLLRNGAGTVIGAVVAGSPTVQAEV